MTRNSNTFEFTNAEEFGTSAKILPFPEPVKALIFSLVLSYCTTSFESVNVGITATSVDILPSLRSADTPLVAYASEAPKVTLIAYTRSFETKAACHERVFLTLAFVQSDELIVNAIDM